MKSGARDPGAARRPGRDVPAVLRLHGGPGAAAQVGHERVQVVLECLARVRPAVRVLCGEAVRPLGSPVDEVDRRLLLDPDRARACVAAVVDDVVRDGVDRALRRLARRPEEVLGVDAARSRGAAASDDGSCDDRSQRECETHDRGRSSCSHDLYLRPSREPDKFGIDAPLCSESSVRKRIDESINRPRGTVSALPQRPVPTSRSGAAGAACRRRGRRSRVARRGSACNRPSPRAPALARSRAVSPSG